MKRTGLNNTNTHENLKGMFPLTECGASHPTTKNRNISTRKAIMSICVLLFCVLSVSANQGRDLKKEIKGKWLFEALEAPDGYQKGKIVFFEEEGEQLAKIVTSSETIKAKNVKIEKDQVIFDFYVDYEYCKVTLNYKEGLFLGKAETSMGDIPVTAKREIKQ